MRAARRTHHAMQFARGGARPALPRRVGHATARPVRRRWRARQLMTPFTIGWKAISWSWTWVVVRPVCGMTFVKFPASPCSAM